jgi:hypothetical protein
MKHKVLSQHVLGKRVSEVTHELKFSHSTVSTVVKNKDGCLKEVKSAWPVQSVGMENVLDGFLRWENF